MKQSDWLIVLGALTLMAGGGFYWVAALSFAFGGEWGGVWRVWPYGIPALVFAIAFLAVAFRLYFRSRQKAG